MQQAAEELARTAIVTPEGRQSCGTRYLLSSRDGMD